MNNICIVIMWVLEFKADCCPLKTICYITPLCFRSKPVSLIPPTPGATSAASVCLHVAAGEAERCDELPEAPGVRVHSDRGDSWSDQPQAESPAHPRTQSEGEEVVWLTCHPCMFILLRWFCKNSVYWYFSWYWSFAKARHAVLLILKQSRAIWTDSQ